MNVEGLTREHIKSHLQIYRQIKQKKQRQNKQKKRIPYDGRSSRKRRGNRSVFCSNSAGARRVVLGLRVTDEALSSGGTDKSKFTTTHAQVEPMRVESSAPDTSFFSVGSTASANQEADNSASPWSPSGTAGVDPIETCVDVDNDNETVSMVQAESSAPDTSFVPAVSAANAIKEAYNSISSGPWSPSAFLDLDNYDGDLQEEINLSSNNGGRDDGIGLNRKH